MDLKSQSKWDSIYANRSQEVPARAAVVLQRYKHWLPRQGVALDFACGRGGNALLFAHGGLNTHAWDISSVGLQQLDDEAKANGLDIDTRVLDLQSHPLETSSFDTIACSYYLDRNRFSAICNALKPGGLLFYETFNATVPMGEGPSNPHFLLDRSELLQSFSELQVLFYEELWDIADADGGTGISRLVARQVALD